MKLQSPSRASTVLWRSAFQQSRLTCVLVIATLFGQGQLIMAEPSKDSAQPSNKEAAPQLEEATFGSGCFWCTEAMFQQLKGVSKVVSGYTGGTTKNPTYEEVCTGSTGHAEVIRVTYDPKVISYAKLLEVFWKTHDPTTLNRQGADKGTQYRSVVFFHNESQEKLAREYMKKLDASGAFDAPIVTQIQQLKEFYPAEDYHQNYFRDNPGNQYCTFVVKKKVEKFKQVFKEQLK